MVSGISPPSPQGASLRSKGRILRMSGIRCFLFSVLYGATLGAIAPLIYLCQIRLDGSLGGIAILIGGFIGGVTGGFLGVVLFPIVRRIYPTVFFGVVSLVSGVVCIVSAVTLPYERGPVPIWRNGVLSVAVVTILYLPIAFILRRREANLFSPNLKRRELESE